VDEQRKVKFRNSCSYILTPTHRNGVFKEFFLLFYTKGTPVLLDEHKHILVYHWYIFLHIDVLALLPPIKLHKSIFIN